MIYCTARVRFPPSPDRGRSAFENPGVDAPRAGPDSDSSLLSHSGRFCTRAVMLPHGTITELSYYRMTAVNHTTRFITLPLSHHQSDDTLASNHMVTPARVVLTRALPKIDSIPRFRTSASRPSTRAYQNISPYVLWIDGRFLYHHFILADIDNCKYSIIRSVHVYNKA